MAVKEDVVYVLEVNPRSSRTIPFVAKATGLPLAKLAAKVMLGHKLKDLGVKEGSFLLSNSFNPQQLGHVAVKEVVLPFLKFTGVDTILGPEMKSTGEVMGIDDEFDKAFFKSELAAYNPLPLDMGSTVFISVCKEDRAVIKGVAQNLKKAGLSIVGTKGTVEYLRQCGIDAKKLKKLHEGSPNVVEMMHAQEIKLVINSPTDKQSYKDGYEIRRACIELGVPYITTMQAAKAAASAILGMQGSEIEVKSINILLNKVLRIGEGTLFYLA
jgi:carbamoyl-phosphate synthase large subunit